MWFLYLDESGDLGFDFVNKRPSKYFTITILALSKHENDRKLAKEVRVTLRRKLNPRGKRTRLVQELKGTDTTFAIKQYFYKRIASTRFGVYSMTLNKKKVYERLTREKDRVYNYIAKRVLDNIPFEKYDGDRVVLTIDRSKGKPEIENFNRYISNQLKARLNPNIPLDIYHMPSHEVPGLQIADLFSWGIFQKYERSRTEWRDLFQEKVLFDELFLG